MKKRTENRYAFGVYRALKCSLFSFDNFTRFIIETEKS